MNIYAQIALEVVLFVLSSYLLFYKQFIGELAKQTAELKTVKQKTEKIEEVKNSFGKDLENFKQALQLDLGKQIEPLRTELAVLANKRGQIFSLEKESIVEFNAAINTWIWAEMGFNIYIHSSEKPEQLKTDYTRINNAYNNTQIAYAKMKLIVNDVQINNEAHNAIMKALTLKHFIDDKHLRLETKLAITQAVDRLFKKSVESKSDFFMQHYASMSSDLAKQKEQILKDYEEGYQEHFKPAITAVNRFTELAKQHIKNNA